MPEGITVTVNGTTVTAPQGCTVAAVIERAGASGFRRSVTGQLRGPLCGMGICFECRVTVNGIRHARSCQLPCDAGMEIRTDE